MLEPMHSVSDTGTSYESVTEEMQSLYLLSFLLTADHDKAEQRLVSAIGECPEGILAFMDWSVCGHGRRLSSMRSSRSCLCQSMRMTCRPSSQGTSEVGR
jgi:hypothetical protein